MHTPTVTGIRQPAPRDEKIKSAQDTRQNPIAPTRLKPHQLQLLVQQNACTEARSDSWDGLKVDGMVLRTPAGTKEPTFTEWGKRRKNSEEDTPEAAVAGRFPRSCRSESSPHHWELVSIRRRSESRGSGEFAAKEMRE